MIELWTLGTLELRAGGADVRSVLNQPKRLALLAFLALHQPHGFVNRERVLALFWPEQDEEHARSALNRAIYYLRHALGASVLVSRGDEIAINRTELWCDALAFRDAADEQRYAEAIVLYRGDLLAGFHVSDASGFEQWLESERVALARLAHDSAWLLADAEERAGDVASAAQHAAWACDREPYDEASVQRRLLLLDRLGDRAGAVRVHEQFARKLADDLELEPAPETQAIVESIRGRAEVSGNSIAANGKRAALPTELRPQAAPATDANLVPSLPSVAPPRRRTRIVATVAYVCLLAALTAFTLVFRPAQQTRDERLVFIAPIENHTGDAALNATTLAATNSITRRIADAVETATRTTYTPTGRVLRPDSLLSSLQQRARQAQAGTRVSGGLYRERDGLRFHVRVIDAVDGEKAWMIPPIAVKAESIDAAIHELGERATGAVVALLNPATASWFPVATTPPSYDALVEFLRGTQRPVAWEASVNYERAAQLDPSFTLALLSAAKAHMPRDPVRSREITADLARRRSDLTYLQNLTLNWLIALQANNRTAAYEALAGAAALAPTQFLSEFARSAATLYRPRETLRLLDRVDQLRRGHGDSWTWMMRTWLHHQLGEYDKELELALHARSAHPARLDGLYVETRARAALGRVRAVNALIDSALTFPREGFYTPGNVMQIAAEELRAHGYKQASTEIAQRAAQWYLNTPAIEADPTVHQANLVGVLYLAGRWSEARAVALELAALPTTQRASLYGRLGTIAARTGDRAAAQRYLTLLGQLNVADGPEDEVFLARARISALLGDAEGTLTLLRNAVGGQGIDLHTDIDFEPMRDNPAFRVFTRPKG